VQTPDRNADPFMLERSAHKLGVLPAMPYFLSKCYTIADRPGNRFWVEEMSGDQISRALRR
jgi:hypothetical protein